MSVFLLPIKLCNELNTMCAKFWWEQTNNDCKIHWLSWDKLSLPKAQGGMGFRTLRAFNLAILAKQGWKLLKEPGSLLHRCLKLVTSQGAVSWKQVTAKIVLTLGRA